MRCLHCGKRLSLLRKFSDGEFCSAEHRSLFERLNNDLGLQRLIASRGVEEPARSKAAAKQPKTQPADRRQAANIPPMGELVAGAHAKPVVVRRVNQPGVPPLLGPRDSAIPEPELQASIRGLLGGEEVGLTKIEAQPVLPAPPPAPVPILFMESAPQTAVAGFELDVEELDVERDVERIEQQVPQDPPLVGELLSISPVLPSSRRPVTRELRALACWAPAEAAWPDYRATLRPPHDTANGGANPAEVQSSAAEPILLAAMRGLGQDQPAIVAPAGIAFDAGCAILGERAPETPRVPRRIRQIHVRHSGPLSLAGVEHSRLTAPCTGAASPIACASERVLPRLHLAPDATTMLVTADGLALPPTAALWTWEENSASAEAGQSPLYRDLMAMPSLGTSLSHPGPGLGQLAPDAISPLDCLQTWSIPALCPLNAVFSQEAMPEPAFHPELLTVTEVLEMEVLSAPLPEESEAGEQAAAPVQAAEVSEPDEPAESVEAGPPLVESQRPFLIPRPAGRQLVVSGLSTAALTAVWAQSLETAASCPKLRLKIDHADGSGSRAPRNEWRPRAKSDRFQNVHELIPGGRFWRSAPADLKWIALALPLILALVVWSFRGSVGPVEASLPQQPDVSKSPLTQQFSKFQQVLLSRAAVRLYDDFRGGLGAWNGREGWAKTWKYTDSSFLEPGDLAIYTPTLEMRDYSMEFLGQIERRSLNWLFRAKDLDNYYAMRIVITRGGPLPSASMVRYAVINGKESGHVTLPLPMSIRPDTVYRVRMEVRGSQFTTFVQGQVVDNFEDERLTEGGVGFWSPRGDRSLLRWVEVMHQYDYLGRLCALLAPYPLQAGGHQAD